MMLPGVELARKRRIHHHGGGGQEAVASSRGYPPPEQPTPTTMGESALVARRRLEEKLRGFGLGSSAAQSPAFSWRSSAGGQPGGGPARRAAPAASGAPIANSNINFATSREQKKPPPAKAAEPMASGRRATAALQRVNSAASAEECTVCLESFRGGEAAERRQVLNLPCAHRYHLDCVLPWLAEHPHCPCCRTPVISS